MRHADKRYSISNAVDHPGLALRDRRIHFLHVPKCGGTTLRYILESFAAVRGLTCVNEARRDGDAIPDPGAGTVAMGHRRPADIFARGDTCYFTVLREPTRRLRSYVEMVSVRRGQRPEDVVDGLTWAEANASVRLLTGTTGPGDGEAVAAAKQALQDNIHVFGFQEHMTEFIRLLAGMLEIGGIISPRFQTTPPDDRVGTVFDDRLSELGAADAELYAFATALYDTRYADLVRRNEEDRPEVGRSYLRIQVDPEAGRVDSQMVEFAAPPQVK